MKNIYILLVCIPTLIYAQEQPKDNLPEMQYPEKVTQEDFNKIYEHVELPPEFLDDHRKLNPWIRDSIAKVRQSKSKTPKGIVKVKFIVERDGSISVITFLDKSNKKLIKETTSLINQMPKWRPAQQNGRAVRAYATVTFEW